MNKVELKIGLKGVAVGLFIGVVVTYLVFKNKMNTAKKTMKQQGISDEQIASICK